MLRYRLRTLLILLAILPLLLWIGWTKYTAWSAERDRRGAYERMSREFWEGFDRGDFSISELPPERPK